MRRLPVPGATLVLVGGTLLAACSAAGSPAVGSPAGSAGSESPGSESPGAGAPCPTAPAPGDLTDWTGSAADASVIPVLVSSEQACGPSRLLFTFLDPKTNAPVGSPERTASLAFYNLGRDRERAAASSEATFVWAIEGERGLYVAHVTYPEAGEWGVAVTTAAPGSPEETIRVRYQVKERSSTIPIGAPAPATDTPTLEDVGGNVRRLSTDPTPVRRFYETSVAQALRQKKAFVLVFATPAFCTSAICGPTLDRVERIAEDYPTLTFINVEPYQLEYRDGRLQPKLDAQGQLQPVPAVLEWGLQTEPWIFVVDRDGIVRGSFEGVFGDAELRAVLDQVQAGRGDY
ncbi:MAG TPA: hypothetical protein VNJ28_03200 [Candidatus Limnocylindrales bacterium]|nr:hypothetical protein [Candidatus Limnocylindrales bacterium]